MSDIRSLDVVHSVVESFRRRRSGSRKRLRALKATDSSSVLFKRLILHVWPLEMRRHLQRWPLLSWKPNVTSVGVPLSEGIPGDSRQSGPHLSLLWPPRWAPAPSYSPPPPPPPQGGWSQTSHFLLVITWRHITSLCLIWETSSCVKAAFSLLTTRGRLLWLYIYIYIYIYRERERERERLTVPTCFQSLC